MNKLMHPIEPEELMAYLDGELSSEKAAIVAGHLRDCEECQTLTSDVREVSHTVAAWSVSDADSQIPSAIASALIEKPERNRVPGANGQSWRERFSIHWPAAGWVGALAVVFLVVVGSLKFMGGHPQEFRAVGSLMTDAAPSPDENQTGASAPSPVQPAAAPERGRQFGHLQQYAKLQQAPAVKFAAPKPGESATAREPLTSGPMIIRTADLALIAKDFDNARSAVEAILKRHRGYVGELKVGGSSGSGRTLTATLRVPADQLDASLADLKSFGRVASESQSGQDVTSQYVDLEARLANARNTEQRLTDLLRQRTGKLSDVLEVEQEVDRVRGEIEQMEAERKNMSNQVSFATLNATITEEYKAQLQAVPSSTSTQIRNAAVAGYKSMVDGMVGLVLFLLENVPSLMLWLAILFFPARLVWKTVRRGFAQ